VNECILLEASTMSPRTARRWISTRCGEDPGTVEAAELIVSELVSNAVVHAKSDMVLSVRRGRESLHVELEDHGEGEVVVQQPAAVELEDSGRGLRILAALASEWGVRKVLDGKTVWFDLPMGRA
jgi:anti-sigma regulatory factor (Ser/Thr protein kinase)